MKIDQTMTNYLKDAENFEDFMDNAYEYIGSYCARDGEEPLEDTVNDLGLEIWEEYNNKIPF